MKNTEFISVKDYFTDQDIFEAEGDKGIIRRGWDKIKSKVLKMFKGPAVKNLVNKYAHRFLKESDELIGEYVKISKEVKKDFKIPYSKLKKSNEELEKNVTDPDATNDQIRKYEEEKKQLHNRMKVLQENIDDYFKINNLNEEIEKKLEDYTQIISDKIEQSNWLLNVELSKKDKSELMQLWKRKTPHLKLLLKQKFVNLVKTSDIAEIYQMREDLKSMQEETKKLNVASPNAKRALLNQVKRSFHNLTLKEEYEKYKAYSESIEIKIFRQLYDNYDDEVLQGIILKRSMPYDLMDRIFNKLLPAIDKEIAAGTMKKDSELVTTKDKDTNSEAKIKQRISTAFEKWLPKERKRGKLTSGYDYTDYVDVIINVLYNEVIKNKNPYGLNAFKGPILEEQIKKLFYDYRTAIDDEIRRKNFDWKKEKEEAEQEKSEERTVELNPKIEPVKKSVTKEKQNESLNFLPYLNYMEYYDA